MSSKGRQPLGRATVATRKLLLPPSGDQPQVLRWVPEPDRHCRPGGMEVLQGAEAASTPSGVLWLWRGCDIV